MKKYILILITTVVFCNSCQDFLDEKMIATITQDYFTNDVGLDQLITGTYYSWRWKYNWTDGAYNFEMGTDIGWVGSLNWSTFNVNIWNPATGSSSTSGVSAANEINNLMGSPRSYPGINDCNLAVELITNETVGGKYSDANYAAGRLAEVRINRARWLYLLNTMLGEVYMGVGTE